MGKERNFLMHKQLTWLLRDAKDVRVGDKLNKWREVRCAEECVSSVAQDSVTTLSLYGDYNYYHHVHRITYNLRRDIGGCIFLDFAKEETIGRGDEGFEETLKSYEELLQGAR